MIVDTFFYNLPDPTATEDDDNAEEDEDKYVDEVDMPGTKVCIRYFLISVVYNHKISYAHYTQIGSNNCGSHNELLLPGI